MAYILRSMFFIGVVYTLSPVKDDTSDLMTLAANAPSANAGWTQTSAALARLSGEPAEVALQAARSWATLDDVSKDRLRRLIAEMVASDASPIGRMSGPAGGPAPAPRGVLQRPSS